MPHREDEVIEAERDRALDLLDGFERMITRIGGMLTHEDQRLLRAARAFLEETGKRKSVAPALWVDRECRCTKHAGKRIPSIDCEIVGHKPGNSR